MLPLIHAESLELLEWPRLCQHLATFASTKLGMVAAEHLPIPQHQAETERLLAQTQEVYDLERQLPKGLCFDGIAAITDCLERASLQGLLSGLELLTIATTLSGARTLRRTIEQYDNLPTLSTLVAELRTYPELEQEIYRCLNDDGKVSERASPKLADIREQQRRIRDRVYDLLQKLLQRHTPAIQELVITQRADRFVIPVKATHKDGIPGIVHDTSMSGATLYIEPNAAVALNNQLRQLHRQEQAEEETIRRRLTEQVAAVSPDLERLLIICTTLDLAAARARYSLWLEANPPRFIAPTEPIVLRQLRHPLLWWQHHHEQGRSVVPIEVTMPPQLRVVAMTGPNTGGKTVTLKTLGLAMLMAKVGLFIPAREPVELPWFKQILVDIGDEQSLQQSLSTFSGHIRRICRILQALTPDSELNPDPLSMPEPPVSEAPRSLTDASDQQPAASEPPTLANTLVLLDEVGAGTDPSEGSALAIALLKYLADHTRLTIATTHFGELKALKYNDDRFENASVEFDHQSLSPTYRLLWGIPGRSNALAIARRLGLNPEIIQQAQTQVGGTSEEVNQVIAGLEAQRRRQEQKAQETAQLLHQTEQLHQAVSQKAAHLQTREQALQAAQEQAVQQAIAQAKAEIAQVIRTLQRGNPTAADAQQATTALNQIAQQHLPSRQSPPAVKPGYRPQVGDRVRIPCLGQTAEVLSLSETDELTVRFGLMKMTVPLDDVESLTGEKPTRPPADPRPTAQKSPSVATAATPPPLMVRTDRNTIDLRGSRVADAEPVLDQAIAKVQSEQSANLQGTVWIIHGHGTGKLKQGVHEFLRRHPHIQRFELADRAEGGSGVTIAYLR